jgi:hypothetical protein
MVVGTWLGCAGVGCGGAEPVPAAAPTNSPFTRTEVEGLGDPEVVIDNQAGRPIRVSVEGPTSAVLDIPSGESRQTKLPPGAYRYRAEARGAVPFDGTESFQADGRYTWTFVIQAKYPPPPEALRAQLQAALSSGLSAFEGVGMGDALAAAPAGLSDEGNGWRTHPTGWGVRYQDGHAVAFRMQQNFMAAVGLYEQADLIQRFGEPTERMKPEGVADGEILFYQAIRAGFLVKLRAHRAVLAHHRHAPRHGRVDQRRDHLEHLHRRVPQLVAQRLAERVHRRLGGGVARRRRHRHPGGAGGHVDERRARTRRERGQEELGQGHGGQDVGAELALEQGVGVVVVAVVVGGDGGGVVDEHVELGVLGAEPGHRGLAIGGLGDVAADRRELRAARAPRRGAPRCGRTR